MSFSTCLKYPTQCRTAFGLAVLGLLAACAAPTPDGRISDPYETQNRAVHAFNKDLDRTLLRPVALSYTNVVPDPVEIGISNMHGLFGIPGTTINQVLQADFAGAGRNILRFSINATLGLAGLMDAAADLGLPEEETDFGETMAVWGVPEGAYLSLPFLGPSTQRDAMGRVVDFALDPLRDLSLAGRAFAYGTRLGDFMSTRGRFTATFDSVLYDSVDSYAATRDVFIQNRSFELEQAGVATTVEEDSYADIFGE